VLRCATYDKIARRIVGPAFASRRSRTVELLDLDQNYFEDAD
jgi:hypothetical protein